MRFFNNFQRGHIDVLNFVGLFSPLIYQSTGGAVLKKRSYKHVQKNKIQDIGVLERPLDSRNLVDGIEAYPKKKGPRTVIVFSAAWVFTLSRWCRSPPGGRETKFGHIFQYRVVLTACPKKGGPMISKRETTRRISIFRETFRRRICWRPTRGNSRN